MLRELSVQNLALIEDVHIELEGGYCVWTGETGAGKSLLLTALGLVLGGKASADLIRSGKSEGRAAAVFEVVDPNLRNEIETILGGSLEDDQLIMTRRIAAQGRGGARSMDCPSAWPRSRGWASSLSTFTASRKAAPCWTPISSATLLDAYGGHREAVDSYQCARQSHEELRRKRQALLDSVQTRLRERALLEFERDELTALDPTSGEYDELGREAHRLQNAEQIRTAAATGYSLLYEADRSAQDLLKRVARTLEPLAQAASELAEAAVTLGRLAEETREVAFSLRDLGQGWDDDPSRLDDIEARLAIYRRLSTRFHCAPDALADRRETIESTLNALDQDDADLLTLDQPLAEAWSLVAQAAGRLSAVRRKTAKDFARAVQRRLKPLGLSGARLTVDVVTRELGHDPLAASAPEAGADRIEILFSANTGEEPRPLRKIASGGELSRLTLAVKTVLAGADRIPTLVFDEIDTGVGGRLGSTLGKALAELSRHHQVICVTHLPQMASYADRQWGIRKQVERGRSRTTITPLDHAERIEELALMLRGDSAAEGTRQEALAMLREAQATRSETP